MKFTTQVKAAKKKSTRRSRRGGTKATAQVTNSPEVKIEEE